VDTSVATTVIAAAADEAPAVRGELVVAGRSLVVLRALRSRG
jgi:hypothetical protein